MATALLLASLVAHAAGTLSESAAHLSERYWSSDRPVSKVVQLLKDMQSQLQKEGEEDEKLYDNLACWCETNEKSKTKAIDDANAHISDLTAAIEEFSAKSAQLGADIESLKEDIAQKTDALNKAAEIREKENTDFNAEEKDLIGSITALKGAIITLSKHQSLNQEDLMRLIQMHARGRPGLLNSITAPSQRDLFISLLQQPEVHHHVQHGFISLLQQKSKVHMRQPASGEIYGILKQMKETFERNLEASRSNEQNAAEVFASVKSAKQSEISAGTKMSETKETELTDANSNNAQAKEDLEDTRTALDADTTFLQNLKLKCQAADKEWEERKKVRQSEISAVSEAIEILANDDAKDLFSRTLGFLQVKSSAHRTRRSRASALLQKAASASGNPDMAALAMRMRLDSFAEVKRGIDKMVADLKRQQADEVDQKDWCNDELNTNEAQTSAKNDLKDDLNTKKEDLASAINTLNEAIAALKSDIADAQVAMKKASETRETENHEFQMTVSDQRATQTILTKAIDRLKQFYAKKLFLMQRDGQAPPEGFQKYKKSGGASGVIAMLEGIVADAKELEEKAIAAENDASQAYESFVQDTNNEIDAKANAITDKLEERAKLDATSTHASSDLKHTASDLGKLANYAGELHGSCDFLLKNFDERQTSRAEEIDALGQAKAIFSGADLR